MKIIQLTDLHLPEKGRDSEAAWRDWDKLRNAVDEAGADLIVNTGDVCRGVPQSEIYERYYAGVNLMKTPMVTLGGNHDALEMMARYESVDLSMESSGYSLLFLHCEEGQMVEGHKRYLFEQLEKSAKPLVVFMHYPPLYAGSRYMDEKHAFKEIELFLPALDGARVPVCVFCGHYHMARQIKVGSLEVNITPSPYLNINPAYDSRVSSMRYSLPFRKIFLEEGMLRNNLCDLQNPISVDEW
jgi:DNA repair exonuclease SbcCD nuclease subunit